MRSEQQPVKAATVSSPPGEGPQGLLLIDKPAGWTSHDAVAWARRLCNQRRIGHCGTLDPAATGLLVLCLGRATRLVEYLTGHDKRYEGLVRLGITTDSDDAAGEMLASSAVPPIGDDTLRKLEAAFSGPQSQRPPAHSAIQVGGVRAYTAARRGVVLDLPPRPVVIHELRLRLVEPGVLAVEAFCGPGTYIRSLARDIGERLGCGAHLASLRRLSSGPFDVSDSVTLEDLERVSAHGELRELLLPADEGLLRWPAALLEGVSRRSLLTGGSVTVIPGTPDSPLVRAYDADGSFLAVTRIVDGTLRPIKVLASG